MKQLVFILTLFITLTGKANDMSQLNLNVDFLVKKNTPISSSIFEDGKYNLGWFDTPFEELNISRKPHLQKFRLKKWHYFSFTSPRYTVGLAVVNAGYISNMFLYLFDFETKEYKSFEHTALLSNNAKVADNSISGTTTYQSKRNNIIIENLGDEYLISFICKNKNKDIINGNIKVSATGEALVNSREVKPGKVVYTHQNSMMRAQGIVTINNKEIIFDSSDSYSAMDYTAGLHTYKTSWNWASAAGVTTSGDSIAINFASDIGEGTNDVVVYWIGEKSFRVSKAMFIYQTLDDKWKIKSTDETIDLTFTPSGKREGNLNIGLIKSKFYQPFGIFSGTITTPDRQVHRIENMKGVTEEHFSKW